MFFLCVKKFILRFYLFIGLFDFLVDNSVLLYMNAIKKCQLVCSCICLIVAHDAADPAVVAANTGVDAGVSLHGTVVTPGHDSLQLTVADQRTTRVSL